MGRGKPFSLTVIGMIAVWLLLLPGGEVLGKANGKVIDYLNEELETITGEKSSLNKFRGDVLLVVNVASRCGYTPQYEGLEALYREFGDRGFKVIGIPANNFLDQEPGTNEEILQFCRETYDVTFPMIAKISVKGDDQHPLYTYLTEQSPFPGEITWNFNKFLLDREGKVVARFGTKVKPDSDEVVAKIREILGD